MYKIDSHWSKKVGMAFLAIVLVCSFMTVAGAKVTINYNHGRWRDKAIRALNRQLEAFEQANPDIQINLTYVPWTDVRTTILRDVATGSWTTDMMDVDSTQIGEFHSLRILYDLSESLELVKDQFVEGSFDESTFNSGIYSVPFCVWPEPTMFYLVDVFEELGIEPASHDNPWTMSEALEVARKLTADTDGDGKIDRWGWVERAKLGAIFFKHFWWHLRVSGVDLIKQGKNGKWESNIKDPKVVEAIQFYINLVLKYKVAPKDILAYGWEEWRGGFTQGNIAMGSMGMWASGQLYDKNPDLRWGAMPLPYRDQPTVCLYHDSVAIVSKTEYPQEAWKFVKSMVLDAYNSVEIADARGSLSPLKVVLEDPSYLEDPRRSIYKPFVKDMYSGKYRLAFPSTHPKYMPLLANIVGPTVQEVIMGRKSFEDALSYMDEECKRMLR